MTSYSISRAIPGCASNSRWPHRKTLAAHNSRRRLVAGRLSHYSALYEVQNHEGIIPLDAVQHLHHMVHGSSNNAMGPLYLATFCALSVTLGALLYNLTNVLNEYFALQQQLSPKQEDKALLYGVDVSSSKMFQSQRVRAAAAFAAAAHAEQVRKTGEPYVTHCIETALIVESNLPHWRQDSRHETAVVAALLHDVLDDTHTTPEALSAAFGPTVTAMVVSVSKLSAVNQMLRRDKRKGVVRRDEDFWQTQWRRLKRMMFEAVVEEPLVILVKLADRLHNMRTVYALPPAKQQAVAEETLAVWCSMAASLGWHSLKSEMEDLCFAVLDTSTFCALRQELDKLWSSPPVPRSRRRVKSSRRQLQLRQFAEQQQELAAERAAKWGQGLLMRLQQRLGLRLGIVPPSRSPSSSSSSSSSRRVGDAASSTTTGISSQSSATADSSSSSSGEGSSAESQQQQQQQQHMGLNLLLQGLWPSGPSAAAAAVAAPSGLLPAPLLASQDDVTPNDVITSHMEPTRPSGAEWGVTDAALSLRSLLGVSLNLIPPNHSSSSSSSSSSTAAAADAAAAAADASVILSSSKSSSKGQLSAQQQQLRNILSTVVPFDGVSLTGSNPGLTWSAQQGLSVLKEAASRLFNELAVGSFSGGLNVEVQGRLKSLRSVHNKMERKQCSVEEVFDARALRVVVDDGGGARLADAVQCCYRLVSAVHKLWRPIHGEFDDYIANPKPSGYQALHTAVWGPGGAALEVQIKTAGMHEHAEYGGAAHWQYKEVLWGSAPAAAAAVDNVERNVAAAAAAAAAAAVSSSSSSTGLRQQQLIPLVEGAAAAVAAAAVAAAAASARRAANVQVLPTVLFTFDDDGQLVSSTGSSSSSGNANMGSESLSTLESYDSESVFLSTPAAKAVTATALARAVAASAGLQRATAAAAAAGGRAGSGVQFAERPRSPQQQQQQQQLVSNAAAAAAAVRQQSTGSAVGTLDRPVLKPLLPQQQQQQQQQFDRQAPMQQQQQQQPMRPAPPVVYAGQPVLRISDRLRYGVVLATSIASSSSSSNSSDFSVPRPSPDAAAALATTAGSSSSSSEAGSSSGGSTITCVIMSGGTNPDHPWRMPDYGFYEQLLQYASAQGWRRPGQGDWHARLEEYVWCRDGRWHRRDHMGYLHPHTTLTLLEGYEQDAQEAALGPAAAPAAAAAAAGTMGYSLQRPISSSSSSSSSRSTDGMQLSAAEQGRVEVKSETPALKSVTRAVPDAAMLRHSWATGGASSGRRQQQQQLAERQQTNAAAAAGADTTTFTVSSSSSSSSSVVSNPQQELLQATGSLSSNDSVDDDSSSSSSSSSGGGGDKAEPAFAGTAAAAGSDWAATAAKAAQLRSVIEWGLEAYGVNAAGSEPSSEVSVVIWPGGSIEDVPRGTTAGQILREKGVFAILDGTAAAASSSSSSDSDADAAPHAAVAWGGSSSSGRSKGGRALVQARQQQQQQQVEAVSDVGSAQLVNVNNRLVSEDTVLRDGDLVILAREKIKI